MKTALAMALVFICVVSASLGEEFEIISQNHSVIVWRNPYVNATCRVEWALSAAGPWHRTWTNFEGIVVTKPVAHKRLPKFFRVVSDTPTNMPVSELLAHYVLDGNALDVTGNGYDGIMYGGTYVEDRFGAYQGALQFDGSLEGYVDVGTMDIQLPTTVSLWFNSISTNSDWSTLFGWNSPTAPYSGIQMSAKGDGRMVVRMGNDSTDYYTTNTPNGDGQWHMLTCSRDTQNVQRVYVDGQLETSFSVPVSIGSNHHLYLGRSFRPNDYFLNEHFNGIMDEVRIYNRVLSDAEVQSLWSNSP